MVDFGKFDKMIEISGKVDKLNTCNGFSSLFKEELNSFESFYILVIEEI